MYPNRKQSFGLILLLLLLMPSMAEARQSEDIIQPPLTDYEGSYEGRDFEVVDDVLTYFRQGMQSSIALEWIDMDHFRIIIPPGAQVQTRDGRPIPTFKFERDEDGKVIKMTILDPDGGVMGEHLRTGDVGSSTGEDTVH